MNVLVLSAVLPYPLYSGGQVRLFNLLKRLSTQHTITLVSYIRSNDEEKYVKELSFCDEVITVYRGRGWQPSYIFNSFLKRDPLLYSTYDLEKARQTIGEVIGRKHIDLIHLEPGYVFKGLPITDIPIVVAEHNVEHQVYEGYVHKFRLPFLRPLLAMDVEKLKIAERKVWSKSKHIITVSEEDKKYISSCGYQNVSVVPNGVDETWFKYHPKKTISSRFMATFIGNFRWMQNQDAVYTVLTYLWPQILESYPQARLQIVGQDFPERFTQYITHSVTLKQSVKDIRDVFETSDMLLAPISIGGGTKYKILEAMASGVPVITTTKGIEGLDVIPNTHLLVAQDLSEWVGLVESLINSPKKVSVLCSNARKLIEKKYSWTSIAQKQHAVWNKNI